MPAYKLRPEISSTGTDLIVGDAGARAESWVLLGHLAESGARRNLKLDTTAEQVVAILGKRGTGKSYSLGVLLEGLGAGPGTTQIAKSGGRRAALVFDVLDIFWSSALPLRESSSPELQRQYERAKRAGGELPAISVDVWIPAGCQNPEIDLPQTKVLRIAPCDLSAEDWATIFEVDLVSEPRGMLLEELVRKVSMSGWKESDGTYHGPMPFYSFVELMDCLENDDTFQQSYTDGTVRSIRQRLGAQAASELFAGHPTPLTEVLKDGRVSVLMLARASDPVKRVIVAILTRRILRERRDASFARKRLDLDPGLAPDEQKRLREVVEDSLPRTWLLVDEAQVLAPSDESTLSGDALVKYAKEGRNYGLSMALTSQQPTAVDSRLMSQVETLLVHQLTSKADIDVALKSVKSLLPDEIHVDGSSSTPDGLIRSLEQGDALFSCANGGKALLRACVVKIRPRVTPHGGYEA